MFQFRCKSIRFLPDGQLLLVFSEKGSVILLLTTEGRITVGDTRCINLVCHSDATTQGSVHFSTSRPAAIPTMPADGEIEIPAAVLCFFPHGNTVWVHDEMGSTILRLRATGGLEIDEAISDLTEEDDTFFAHFHMQESVDICLVADISKKYGLIGE